MNKSPVFGRLRLTLGLPAGWVAEFGYTPPLVIDGTHARDLVALAIGRRVLEHDDLTLSVRAFGQHGAAQGDITCPAELVGVSDPEKNPVGCEAASRDRIALNHYGADLTAGWGVGTWHWHAGVGLVRTELAVQVDARTFSVRDRSRLLARGVLPYLAIGASRDLNTRWRLGTEVLYVPLAVRRDPNVAPNNDPLFSLRVQLRYRSD